MPAERRRALKSNQPDSIDGASPQADDQATTKAKLRGAIEAVDKLGLTHSNGRIVTKHEIFKLFKVSPATGYRMLSDQAQNASNSTNSTTRRGRPSTISADDIHRIEQLISEHGWDSRTMTWDQLAQQCHIENLKGSTLRQHMKQWNWSRCIACKRGWVNEYTAKQRVEYAKAMLQRYPNPEDWKHVRFSDESHFVHASQGRVDVVRTAGERYCANCSHQDNEPADNDSKRYHCWTAVGFNFKEALYFYDIPGNHNGRMTMDCYTTYILDGVVRQWVERGDFFVLEEDGDAGYGKKQDSPPARWKRQHGVTAFWNHYSSPDLSILEDCWSVVRDAHLRTQPCPEDDDGTKQLVIDGWDKVSQHFINERVLQMPQRLQAVIDMDGQMTVY